MNAPNILTAIRFIIIPIFGYYLYIGEYLTAIAFFTLGGLTDILDGYIARKFNIVTSWGKLADPIADKLIQITALVILTYREIIPLPILIIVVAKEIFMGIGSLLLIKKENTVVAANWYGKLATVIFYFAIVMTIALKEFDMFKNLYTELLVNIFMVIAVLSTLFAFFMYTLMYRKIRSD